MALDMNKKKNIVSFFAILLFINSCTNNSSQTGNSQNKSTQNEGGTQSKKQKNFSSRDYSITKENAYNDLFLDSSKLETFIVKNNISDSLAGFMRSFYNCLLYTSDAADEEDSVDLGGRR